MACDVVFQQSFAEVFIVERPIAALDLQMELEKHAVCDSKGSTWAR
jgi:hypothetical protein